MEEKEKKEKEEGGRQNSQKALHQNRLWPGSDLWSIQTMSVWCVCLCVGLFLSVHVWVSLQESWWQAADSQISAGVGGGGKFLMARTPQLSSGSTWASCVSFKVMSLLVWEITAFLDNLVPRERVVWKVRSTKYLFFLTTAGVFPSPWPHSFVFLELNQVLPIDQKILAWLILVQLRRVQLEGKQPFIFCLLISDADSFYSWSALTMFLYSDLARQLDSCDLVYWCKPVGVTSLVRF